MIISLPWWHPEEGDEAFSQWKHLRPGEHFRHFSAAGLTRLLASAGYSVITISSGEDSIRGLGEHGTPNILTVIARKNPKIASYVLTWPNAFEATQKILKQFPNATLVHSGVHTGGPPSNKRIGLPEDAHYRDQFLAMADHFLAGDSDIMFSIVGDALPEAGLEDFTSSIHRAFATLPQLDNLGWFVPGAHWQHKEEDAIYPGLHPRHNRE